MTAPRTKNLLLLIVSIALGAAALVAIALSKFLSGPLILIIVAAALVGFIVTLVLLARAAPRPVGRAVGRIVLAVLGALVCGYAILLLIVTFGQDTLANRSNAFFQPKRLTEVAVARLAAPDVERLEIGTPDGALLRGWLVHGSGEGKAPLVIYFGGSGSESSQVHEKARLLAPWSVALVNYRGFGESTGLPTPATAQADALWLYDILAQRADVDASRIVPVGYSLGTGMAVEVAEQRPVAGVVLFAPFDRLKLANPGTSAVWSPLQALLKPYFNSIGKAPNIHAPLLVLVGSQDRTFPPELGRAVAAAWGGPSEVKLYEGEGHSLSEHNERSWLDVKAFLDTLQAVK
jgi:uncharacterized protein